MLEIIKNYFLALIGLTIISSSMIILSLLISIKIAEFLLLNWGIICTMISGAFVLKLFLNHFQKNS